MTPPRPPSAVPPAAQRLQKVLATAGFGSRRQCEQLIEDGRVEIDREIVTTLGTRVDPASQQIRVDGVVVKPPRIKCFILHKPVGVVSTARDPWARTRVIDLVDDPDRLFTVGRLDKSSSGLILVTNDGDLAQRLTHPSYGVEKVYRVVVAGKPSTEAMQQLRQGIHLAEGKARVQRVTLKKAHRTQSVLEIVLTEGRNREIRRLLSRVGHKVQQLKRISVGPVKLGELPMGAYRELDRRELAQLREAADQRKQGRTANSGGGASRPSPRGRVRSRPSTAQPRSRSRPATGRPPRGGRAGEQRAASPRGGKRSPRGGKRK